MKKVMALLRYGLYILLWAIIAGVIALIISNNSTLIYKDAIFIEGILLIIVGFFSSMRGTPISSINLIGQDTGSSYNNYTNLEAARREQEKPVNKLKKNLSIGVSYITLIIGGLITMLIGCLI
ncbi:MAG: hypothetical protein E7G24_08025 [Clostridium celatum]|nr:hypothetical protein [Clostridium celatum]